VRHPLLDKTIALLVGVVALALVVEFIPASAIRVVIAACIGAFIMHIIDYHNRKG
jgi:hypothetical protein